MSTELDIEKKDEDFPGYGQGLVDGGRDLSLTKNENARVLQTLGLAYADLFEDEIGKTEDNEATKED